MNIKSIETTLERYTQDHFKAFTSLTSDPVIMHHAGGPIPLDDARVLFNRFVEIPKSPEIDAWAVIDAHSRQYIGHAALKQVDGNVWEIIVVLDKSVWNHGIGSQVAGSLILYGFGMRDLNKIIATIDPDHVAGIRIAEKTGMSFDHWDEDEEGRYPVYFINRDQWQHHTPADGDP